MRNRSKYCSVQGESRKFGPGSLANNFDDHHFYLIRIEYGFDISSRVFRYPRCRICSITLKCGKRMSGLHIRIGSTHLSTCEELPANKVNGKFPDRLLPLWNELQSKDISYLFYEGGDRSCLTQRKS